jgi:uncharacterized protein YjbI with pentapeptide repeats
MAILRNADLRMALLDGANLTGADLMGALLPHGYRSDAPRGVSP